MAKTLYVIDGHAQIFRAYYAPFRDLNAPDGEPTRATYVFTQMLLNLIRNRKPDYLVMAVDTATETVFRRAVDPAYKANRQAPPEDLAPQVARIIEIVESAGIPVLQLPGFEADDIIATIAARLSGQDIDVYVVSKDKDLFQILSGNVRLYDLANDQVTDAGSLESELGFRPDQAIEIQILTGDPTDNVVGVKGIGPKTAVKLIGKYGSAQAVIDHARELTPKQRDNVLAFAAQIDITRQLVTLRTDVPLAFDLESARFRGLNREKLRPIFERLGFIRLVEALGDAAAPPPESEPAGSVVSPLPSSEAERHYTLVDTDEGLNGFVKKLGEQKIFALDTETTGLNPIQARLVGLSFSWKSTEAWYIPVRSVLGRALDESKVLAALRPILEDPEIKKVGQNIKYDLLVLRNAGVETRGIAFDTMIASFVLDPLSRSHGMDSLAKSLLGYTTIPISDLIGKGKDQITMDQVDPRRVCEYAAEDADITWRLYEVLSRQIDQSSFKALFCGTEMPLVEVLAEMEFNGVTLDRRILSGMSNSMADRMADLTRQIHREVGREFNIDSPKQLAEVLFDELDLRVVRKTKTGRSTDAETLGLLAFETGHPVPRLILEYRELAKLKNTYVDKLPEMICEKTGRIHASFNQTGAVTGRLSSSDPNLQNIPVRSELGREIRRAFVPGDLTNVLLTADYSQIELRMLAHFSRDEALLRAFAENVDIHAFVASQVFGVDVASVTKDQRSRAKAVNFGIIYGQSAYGLARGTGMGVSEAERFIRTYFERYPKIRFFIDRCIQRAREEGFVTTILGRRRPIPELRSGIRQQVSLGERLAVNTILQGSAADLIKQAMIGIHHRIRHERRPSRMLIQVHDELAFETPESVAASEADFIRHEMTHAIPLDVPIVVDVNWGKNWLEGK